MGGVIQNGQLVAESELSISHATAYHAVWCRNLRELFLEAKKTGVHFENFIDIGSGKGKACLYAHTKHLFKRILGIEFSAPLLAIADKNKAKVRAADVSFLKADATEFELPHANNLVFMFNPFDDWVLERFISKNLNHFKEARSVIAYANDVHRMSLIRLGFQTIFRNQTRRISLYKYA